MKSYLNLIKLDNNKNSELKHGSDATLFQIVVKHVVYVKISRI
jgi:hypothetical protein